MPNKQRSTTDPMAEDELNDILTEFAFGIIHLQKELEHDKKHHTFTATHGHRDKALAAINAYTTNKIIEARIDELERLYLVYGSKDKPASLDNVFSLGKKGEVAATPIKKRLNDLKALNHRKERYDI
jgi:hypothetical protein